VRRRALAAGLLLGQLALSAGPAHGQWWPFKRKKPQPPPAPALPQAPPLPAGLPGYAGAGAPAAPTPAEAAAAAQAADRERYLREARARELQRDTTVQNAQDRLTAWSLVRAIDPADPEASAGHERARQDLELARRREQSARAQAADSAQRAALRSELGAAKAAADAGDLKAAEVRVGEALAAHPEDPQARSMQAAIAARRRAEEARKLYLMLGGGLLLGSGGVGYVAWRALRDARQRARERENSRQANVQVIDGVARGRFVPLAAPVFRIGAVGSETPEEKNDLVISDADRRVSRHHCTIVKRDGRYYLIDASRNGTWLNGEALPRGEQRRLEDGDELVIADAARLKFLVT
jgi:hypothetical protein